jgi:hypothetical protein
MPSDTPSAEANLAAKTALPQTAEDQPEGADELCGQSVQHGGWSHEAERYMHTHGRSAVLPNRAVTEIFVCETVAAYRPRPSMDASSGIRARRLS